MAEYVKGAAYAGIMAAYFAHIDPILARCWRLYASPADLEEEETRRVAGLERLKGWQDRNETASAAPGAN